MRRLSQILFLSLCFFIFFGISLRSHAEAASAQSSTVVTLTVSNPTTGYSIIVSKNGTGTGVVTSSDGVISCGSVCADWNIPLASTTVLTALADPGSYFVGWSGGGCTGTGTCSVATDTSVTATFDIIPTPPAPSGGGSGSVSGGSTLFVIQGLSVAAGTSSATVYWYTSFPAVSSISWGLNSEGASGSGSETAFSQWHSIGLDNLSPGTIYFITITATMENGRSITESYYFRTMSVTGIIPQNVTHFAGSLSFGGNIALSWINPSDIGDGTVLITRGTRFFPRDPAEGYIVFQGKGESALDTSAESGRLYYYTAFVIMPTGERSSGALLTYGLPGKDTGGNITAPTSTPYYGGTHASSTVTIPLISFSQNNQSIVGTELRVPAWAGVPVFIEIPKESIPKDTGQAIIFITYDDGLEQSFMFEKRNDGSLRALVPGPESVGKTPFHIDFMQPGVQVRITGSFETMGAGVSGLGFQSVFLSPIALQCYILILLIVLFVLTVGFLILVRISFKKS